METYINFSCRGCAFTREGENQVDLDSCSKMYLADLWKLNPKSDAVFLITGIVSVVCRVLLKIDRTSSLEPFTANARYFILFACGLCHTVCFHSKLTKYSGARRCYIIIIGRSCDSIYFCINKHSFILLSFELMKFPKFNVIHNKVNPYSV